MIHNSKQSIVPGQEQTYQKKKFEDLNLMDAFLFDVSTENPENAEKIARAIVRRVIGRELQEIVVENQKQFRGAEVGKRGIRMDLWVREKIGAPNPSVCLYDIEPNLYEDDLPKRSRFYQAKADARELPVGSRFKELPQLIMIWILPYDPFGDDRMIYTVKNTVVENKELIYNDGVLKLFLYTKGRNGGSKELKSLLTYFEETTQDNAVDAELKEIQKIVGNIKHSYETEERYMTLQEMIDYEKADSYKIGIQQGIQQGIIRACQKLNQTKEETIETLMHECEITEKEAKEYIQFYWEEENATN